MFDIGFSELVVIAVVALIVIGPERLPKVARTMGHLFGRLQRYVNDVKSDINREMELDELRKLQQQVQTAAREIETSVEQRPRATSSPACAASSAAQRELRPSAGRACPPRRCRRRPSLPPPRPVPAAARADRAGEPPRQGRLPGFDPL